MAKKTQNSRISKKRVIQLPGGTTAKIFKIIQGQNIYVIKKVFIHKKHLALHQVQILQQLQGCKSVCNLIDWNQNKHSVNIFLQFGGQSLKKLIQNKQPQSYSQKMQILKKIAIAYLPFYKSGIVLNDLKPANIVVSINWQVRFIDLALCSQYNKIIGTPYYCRVSQLQNNLFYKDAAAYGAVCYQVIQGHLPYPLDKIENQRQNLIKYKKQQLIFAQDREINGLIRGCLNPEERKSMSWPQIFEFWNIDY